MRDARRVHAGLPRARSAAAEAAVGGVGPAHPDEHRLLRRGEGQAPAGARVHRDRRAARGPLDSRGASAASTDTAIGRRSSRSASTPGRCRRSTQAGARRGAHAPATGLTIAAHTGDGRAAHGGARPARRGRGAARRPSSGSTRRPSGTTAFHDASGRRGAWVEFDGIGPTSVARHVELVRRMKSAGAARTSVLVSHDAGWYHVGEPGGGQFRPYDTLFTDVRSGVEGRRILGCGSSAAARRESPASIGAPSQELI